MERGGRLEYHFMQKQYINPKNISCDYTINYYKSMRTLGDIDTIKLADIAVDITDGTRVKRNYIDHGVKIINVGDFKEGTIYTESIKSISRNGLKNKDYIKENDILITSVGKSGQIAKATPDIEDYVISSDIIRVRLKQSSNIDGLVGYFKSKSGKYALESIKKGTLNRISISDIKELKVPLNYNEISFNSVNLLEKREKANKLYNECIDVFSQYIIQSEDLFEIPKIDFIESYVIETERFDPKYYTYLESKLYKITHSNSNNITWQPLRQVVEIKRAIKPNKDENQEVEYINISNVDSDLSIINSNERDLYKNLSSRIRYVLKENELITAKSGSSTGTENHATAIVTKKYKNMMASDAFYNISAIETNPYYLLFLFKQPLILKQIDAGSTGLYFKTINRNEFEDISIPRLNYLIEKKIADKMKNYIKLLQG